MIVTFVLLFQKTQQSEIAKNSYIEEHPLQSRKLDSNQIKHFQSKFER